MGSCISKCSRKRKRHEEDDDDNNRNSDNNNNSISDNNINRDNIVVEDKHLITVPKTPPAPLSPLSVTTPTKTLLSPTSSSSLSAFSCSSTNKTTSSSSSSSLSSSSSIISTYKDKSFSNEFLWSCVQENPHVIHNIGQIKKATLVQKQDIPTKVDPHTTPNKRARSNSPTVSRQKSFRRTLPDRTPMRSPSPSRNRGVLGNSAAAESRVRHLVKRGNVRPSSPSYNVRRNESGSMNREMCTYRIGSKIDAATVGRLISEQESSDVVMEDIDNPLIALDCFIFL